MKCWKLVVLLLVPSIVLVIASLPIFALSPVLGYTIVLAGYMAVVLLFAAMMWKIVCPQIISNDSVDCYRPVLRGRRLERYAEN